MGIKGWIRSRKNQRKIFKDIRTKKFGEFVIEGKFDSADTDMIVTLKPHKDYNVEVRSEKGYTTLEFVDHQAVFYKQGHVKVIIKHTPENAEALRGLFTRVSNDKPLIERELTEEEQQKAISEFNKGYNARRKEESKILPSQKSTEMHLLQGQKNITISSQWIL